MSLPLNDLIVYWNYVASLIRPLDCSMNLAFFQTSDIRRNGRFAEIDRAQYENAVLVYLRGTPIRRPENSVNVTAGLTLFKARLANSGWARILISVLQLFG